MCGIAGYISLNDTPVDESVLQRMTDQVAHRGPDDAGILIRGGVGLGHRRLAIVDLSPDGHQPMIDGESRCAIVFNGEIYNYIELRRELEALGQVFSTASDTEVILKAYRQWGESSVEHFNGMWAFAIHDPDRQVIFMSRDRFGVKPLYYANFAGKFLFGSEIRQILAVTGVRRADRKTVTDFLVSDICEPTSKTFFAGVDKLPGGYNMTLCLKSGRLGQTRYYELPTGPAETTSVPEAAQKYRKCLENAVSLRLRADVRVGTCLSGGLDSSSIATLAAAPYLKERGERFKGITAQSEQESNDESELARVVAEAAGIDWVSVKPTYDDFVASIEDIAKAQEEPFGTPSVVMQHFVMKTARAHGIPVLLDGQGGDETLLGYRHYLAGVMRHTLRAHGAFAMLRELFACSRSHSQMSVPKILLHFVFYSSVTAQRWLYRYRNRYLRVQPSVPEQVVAFSSSLSDLQQLQRLEIERTNLPALLRFEDKNSMWYAIETRLPFLDYRSVECALKLPVESKFQSGWTKYALRLAMDETLPKSITWRVRKLGFEAPSERWIPRHLETMKREVLASKILAEISKPGTLAKHYDSLHHSIQWRLYSVALWERVLSVS